MRLIPVFLRREPNPEQAKRAEGLAFCLVLAFLCLASLARAAAPVSVLVDPSTYALVRPTAAQLANANNLGGAGVSDGDKGDITVSASGATWTIDNGALSLGKLADMATTSLLGRNTAGTGSPEVLSAATARSLLGLVVGTNVQAYDEDLATYAGITPSANVQSLLGAATYAAIRSQLDLEAGTDFLAFPSGTPTGSKFLRDDNSWQSIPGGGDVLAANNLSEYTATASTARTNLGATTVGSNLFTLTNPGAVTFLRLNADNSVTARSAADMRTDLSLVPGTNVQAYDADLTTYAGITPSANVQSLLGAADYSAMRTLLSLVVGTHVQGYDADLSTWAGVTPGTGIPAALATNVGSVGAPVLLNGVAGTPSAIDLTNATNLPARTVAQGGTGQTSLTANNIILGNNTGAVILLAPGSSGNVVTSNGTAWVSSAPPSGMGGNYTVSGNVVTSSGNVTINSATDANIVLAPAGTGETRLVGPGNVTGDLAVGGNLAVTGNSTFATVNATTFNPTAITGATGNLQVWIGNSTTGNFTKGNLVEGAGTTLTKGATDITVGSTDARNFIVGNVTVTTNATGNITLAAGDGVTLTGNNTDKSITINATASGSGAETGDIKFILDSASVPSGWALTGVNGIPAFTTPDADYKAVMKMAGTVATPTFSPVAGAVPTGYTIDFSSATSGVTFMATTNGTDPSRSVGTAGASMVVSSNTTIEVMAYKDGAYLIDSAVASAAYTIDPVPTLTSAEINGTALTLTYSEAVSRGAGYSNAHFDLDMSTTGSNIAVTYVGGDGTTTHTYTAASAAVNGETVDLDFSGAANSIEETGGYNQDLAAITSAAVTNSTAGGGGASYSDNFDGGGQFPISSPWESGPGAWTDMYRNSNALLSSGGDSAARLGTSAATFAADQWAQLKVGSSLDLSGPAVRMDANGNCYFAVGFNNAGTQEIRINKVTADGATTTMLGAAFSLGSHPVLVATDVIRLKAIGSSTTTLEVFINGVSQGTRDDSSSPHTSGQPGVVQLGGTASGDDFNAEDV